MRQRPTAPRSKGAFFDPLRNTLRNNGHPRVSGGRLRWSENVLFSRVPEVGLEPTRPCGQRILSAADNFFPITVALRLCGVFEVCALR